jgi:hypothetical protein
MRHFDAFRFFVSRGRFESLDAGIETKTSLGLRDITVQMLVVSPPLFESANNLLHGGYTQSGSRIRAISPLAFLRR